jgi:hypothetical protein
MSHEESTQDYFERSWFYDENRKTQVGYYTNLSLAKIVDRLTALCGHLSELNSNLNNINHNIAELKKAGVKK